MEEEWWMSASQNSLLKPSKNRENKYTAKLKKKTVAKNNFHFEQCLPEPLQKFHNHIINHSACQVGLVSANSNHVKL